VLYIYLWLGIQLLGLQQGRLLLWDQRYLFLYYISLLKYHHCPHAELLFFTRYSQFVLVIPFVYAIFFPYFLQVAKDKTELIITLLFVKALWRLQGLKSENGSCEV